MREGELVSDLNLNNLPWRDFLALNGAYCRVSAVASLPHMRNTEGILKVSQLATGGIRLAHPGLPHGNYEVPEASLDFTPANFGIWFA